MPNLQLKSWINFKEHDYLRESFWHEDKKVLLLLQLNDGVWYFVAETFQFFQVKVLQVSSLFPSS